MISPELLQRLVCPQNKMRLTLADAALVEQLNRRVAAGELRNLAGNPVEQPLQGGLVREDGQVLYPISDDFPIMLSDEAVALDQLASTNSQP